jgi:Flp pilus assembly pilin Flp
MSRGFDNRKPIGGSGDVIVEPYQQVSQFDALPDAASFAGRIVVVQNATGAWLLGTRKKAGLYRSDGNAWIYLGSQVTIDDTEASTEKTYSSAKIAQLASGAAGASLSAPITALVGAGSIAAGDTLDAGTDFEGFVRRLVLKTFYPTFVNPSATLNVNLGTNVEAGTIATITLSVAFNLGQIRGALVGGLWSDTAIQAPRAGAATAYTIDGTANGTNNSLSRADYQVIDGANTWSASVDYAQGAQPLDSDGQPFGTPLAAGMINANRTIQGRRNAFYGTSSVTATPYSHSAQIRDMAGKLLNPANGSSFTLAIPAGATLVCFAYPATLRDVSSVTYVEGLGAQVKGVFNKSSVQVSGANNYAPIEYKVFSFVPAEAFSQAATYEVTI